MTDTIHPKSFKPEGKASVPKKIGSSERGINESNERKNKQRNTAIPKEVANRMARRIVITTGLPTFSGMSVFIISYIVVSRGIADIAPALTLISSAACFLIGLFGLSNSFINMEK